MGQSGPEGFDAINILCMICYAIQSRIKETGLRCPALLNSVRA